MSRAACYEPIGFFAVDVVPAHAAVIASPTFRKSPTKLHPPPYSARCPREQRHAYEPRN